METKRPRARGESRRARGASSADNAADRGDKPAADPRAASREALIAERAYYRAERRGFEPGHELEDWLEAEAEVDVILARFEKQDEAAPGRAH